MCFPFSLLDFVYIIYLYLFFYATLKFSSHQNIAQSDMKICLQSICKTPLCDSVFRQNVICGHKSKFDSFVYGGSKKKNVERVTGGMIMESNFEMESNFLLPINADEKPTNKENLIHHFDGKQ